MKRILSYVLTGILGITSGCYSPKYQPITNEKPIYNLRAVESNNPILEDLKQSGGIERVLSDEEMSKIK